MSKTAIPEDIAALAGKVGKQFESERGLADFSRLLKKMDERFSVRYSIMNIIAVASGKDVSKRSAYRAELTRGTISRLAIDGGLS
mgnify:FL=1